MYTLGPSLDRCGLRVIAAVLTILLFSTSTLAASPSSADDEQAAVEHYRRATAAYGLGSYDEAAEHYERAFALVPDHALLFNAALSRKRAGQAERATTLFSNYLRLFAGQSKATEARRHLDSLQKETASSNKGEIEAPDKNASPVQLETPPKASPETAPAPPALPPSAEKSPASAIPASAAPAPQAPGVFVSPTAQAAETPGDAPSFWRRHWYWVGAGAAVVVVTGIVLGFALAKGQNSTPTWGRIP